MGPLISVSGYARIIASTHRYLPSSNWGLLHLFLETNIPALAYSVLAPTVGGERQLLHLIVVLRSYAAVQFFRKWL
jgi:hypothetical protein